MSSARNFKHVQALFRLRISSHNLRMETGRYARPQTPENDTLSLYRQAQTVESESHFLLNCDLYRLESAELMRKLAKNIIDIFVLSDDDKFVRVLSNKEKPVTDAVNSSSQKTNRFKNDLL